MIRIFIRITSGILVAVLCTVFLLSYIVKVSIVDQWEEEPLPFIVNAAKTLQLFVDSVPDKDVESTLNLLRTNIDVPFEIVTQDDVKIPSRFRPKLKDGEMAWMWNHDDHGAFIFVPIRGGKRILIAGPSYDDPDPGWVSRTIMLVAPMMVIVLIGAGLSFPVISRLRALETAAKRIRGGDLDARVDVKTGRRDAIKSLATSFNLMAEKNQALLESQQQLVQAVAHELRTPLSRIRFSLEMKSIAKNDAERERREAEIVEELTEIDEIAGELLAFTRYDSGSPRIERIDVRVDNILQEQMRRILPIYSNKSVTQVGVGASEITISAEPRSFDRVMRNLLANALRHAQREVTIRCERIGDNVIVEVGDDGPGIPEGHRARVFEPFTRIDESRSRDSGGVGLGLAIVKRIMDLHGGTVRVEETVSGGAKLVTEWPAA